jgi:hypothetical protein
MVVVVVSEVSDTRDRVIALEVEVRHVNDKLDDMTVKLDEMHEAFTQTKGGWKVALGFAGFIGFLGGIASWVVPWWFNKP